MFRFVNAQGRQIWVKLNTVIGIYEHVEKDGNFTVQTIGSIWTVNKAVVMRLLTKLKARDEDDGDDPDWWKHGRPNPADREDDDESA